MDRSTAFGMKGNEGTILRKGRVHRRRNKHIMKNEKSILSEEGIRKT